MLKPLSESGKDLTHFEQVKETSARKALDNLFAVKNIPLARFIGGFDIENIGEDLTQRVVDAGFNTLKKIKDASIHELSQVDGFAELTAEYLREGVEKLYPQMIQLKEILGINNITIGEVKKMGGKLEGMTFCFTGKLDTMKRPEAEQLVSDNGGTPKSSVVANLTYLVTNSDEPTKKARKPKVKEQKL